MTEQRHDIRDDCEEKCIMHLGDLYYVARVKNISFGGALVDFKFSTQGLHVGENCDIIMDGGSNREYSCEVVRVGVHKVALTFTNFHVFKSVVW